MESDSSESDSKSALDVEKKLKQKARELVERSKNPGDELEQYPSDARSMEKYLDEDRYEEVTMYLSDLARYEDGGVVAFCNWLAENCPNMLYGNHTMWIMMEEDGISEEKIREIYLKVGYDISNQEKETVIDLNSLTSGGSDSEEGVGMVGIIIAILVIVAINVILYFQYVESFAEVYETGFEISQDKYVTYAVFASSETHDCEDDWVAIQEKGRLIFNAELNKTVQNWRWNEVIPNCDSLYNSHGWVFVGTVALEDGSVYRVNASDSSTEVALLGAPSLRNYILDVPAIITVPIFNFMLFIVLLGIFNGVKSTRN